MNVTVSIGRNVSHGLPLSDREWADFKEEVRAEVAFVGEIFQEGEVTGYWEGEAEPSYTVSAVVTGQVSDLVTPLAYFARGYGQEAIALSTSEPHFIKPLRFHDYMEEAKRRARSQREALADEIAAERGIVDGE